MAMETRSTLGMSCLNRGHRETTTNGSFIAIKFKISTHIRHVGTCREGSVINCTSR